MFPGWEPRPPAITVHFVSLSRSWPTRRIFPSLGFGSYAVLLDWPTPRTREKKEKITGTRSYEPIKITLLLSLSFYSSSTDGLLTLRSSGRESQARIFLLSAAHSRRPSQSSMVFLSQIEATRVAYWIEIRRKSECLPLESAWTGRLHRDDRGGRWSSRTSNELNDVPFR